MIRREDIEHEIEGRAHARSTVIKAVLKVSKIMVLPDVELHRIHNGAEAHIARTIDACKRLWEQLYGELRSELAKILDVEKRTELDDRIKAIVANLEFKG